MKLYAKTTSEKSSKGQGGNEFLEIEILAEGLEGIPTRTNLFRIILTVDKNKLDATLVDYKNGDRIELFPRISTPINN